MATHMSQQTIRKRLIEQLRIRQENNRQIVYLMELLEPDANIYVGDSYPHECSFDELANAENDWCEEFVENLERVHPKLVFQATFYSDLREKKVAFVREFKADDALEASLEAKKLAEKTGTICGTVSIKEE